MSDAATIKNALGAEFAPILSSSPDELASFDTTNPLIEKGAKPVLIARPENVERLSALIKAAAKNGVHIVPVSSKSPHTRGGIVCDKPHIVVDLSGWKKSGFVDRRNRVAMIEAGVTYGELADILVSHGMVAPTPLAPRSGKSVVAAVMDRTPSTWPKTQWDVGDPVASTEFVFGTGDIFRTGAAGGPGSIEKQRASGGALKSPMGPAQTDFHRVLQGSQGSMGIVTWITIRAEVKPTIESPRLLGADSLDKLAAFVYPVQRALLGEQCFILNRAAAVMLLKCDAKSLPEYVCLINVAGFDRMPQERLDYQLADLNEIAVSNGLKLEEKVGDITARAILDASTNPSSEADFRCRSKGDCMSLFFLSTLDKADKFVGVFKSVAAKNNCSAGDVGMYIQPVVQNHGCHIEFMVPFDPSDSASVERMKKFERDAVAGLMEAGAFFSRPYGSARDVFNKNPLNRDLLTRIKGIFDPAGVLNPQKFGF